MFLRARRADVVPPAWCIMSYVFIGGAAGQATGFAVASAGDYDGDGIADVAISAVQYDAGAPGFGKSLSVSFESARNIHRRSVCGVISRRGGVLDLAMWQEGGSRRRRSRHTCRWMCSRRFRANAAMHPDTSLNATGIGGDGREAR
jgi:hypothetical protein